MEARKDILSVPEAASLLGCSDVWVIKMIRAGTLEGFKLSGRAWAVSRKSVEKSIAEYEQRDPSRSGRKREGQSFNNLKRKAKPADQLPLVPHTSGKVAYLSMEGAAKRLGCGAATVRRAAKRCGVGIVTEQNRIVAVAEHDLPLLKSHIHETSGNPNWIAARGTGKQSRVDRRRKPQAE
jgi:excisionase family DNA binding protein